MLSITVTDNFDAPENTPAAIGTLRQAIFDANTTASLDTIDFAPNITSITLTQGELAITNPVEIDGRRKGVRNLLWTWRPPLV